MHHRVFCFVYDVDYFKHVTSFKRPLLVKLGEPATHALRQRLDVSVHASHDACIVVIVLVVHVTYIMYSIVVAHRIMYSFCQHRVKMEQLSGNFSVSTTNYTTCMTNSRHMNKNIILL